MSRSLLELARLYGIQTSYLDMTKQRRRADPESLLLVLHAMGAGVEDFGDVPGALARRKAELKDRKVGPVTVAWDGRLGKRTFEYGYHTVEINDQETFVISAPVKAFYSPPQLGRRKPRLGWCWSKNETLGQHHPGAPRHPSSAEEGSLSSSPPKLWGAFAPIYALHSKRNPNAGDLTDFEHLMDWLADLGGSVAGTLPLLGAFLDEPFEASPYSPATRLFWNEFYIDIERIAEFKGTSSAPTPAAKLVDYRAVMGHKRRILEKLANKHFAARNTERLRAYQKFIRDNKGVEDYARFRAVTDRQRKGWNQWPSRLREGKLNKRDYDESQKNYHLYAQWIIQQQLDALAAKARARGQMLYLDLPLGLHPDGFDVWRYREFFVPRVAGGAPPDPVFTKGQNWGFPPMNPEAMRLNRYQYFIALLRNHFRYARLLRIDHVMGLHRLYWIPEGLTGDKGVYVEYPADELYAILCVESHRYQAGIVGENLGTVPPGVNRGLSRHNLRQMYVVQYEIMGNPDEPKLRPVPAKTFASVNTHDMPTFQAFLDGMDIDDRLDLGFLNQTDSRKERRQRATMRRALATLRRSGYRQRILKYKNSASVPVSPDHRYVAVLQFLAESMADIVLVNMEDLWQETLPQNVPATNQERPNWRRRMRPSIEQIRKMAGLAEVLTHVFAHRS